MSTRHHYVLILIFLGGGMGSMLRWLLEFKFNGLPNLPYGTLVANLMGGYLIGLIMGYFYQSATLDPFYRALLITGFCGGLTTFSGFSYQIFLALQGEEYGLALGLTLAHVLGSFLMTFLGFKTIGWL